MIKHFCNNCGRQLTREKGWSRIEFTIWEVGHNSVHKNAPKQIDICNDCNELIKRTLSNLKENEEDDT